IGYQLLQKTPVRHAVQEAMRARAARTQVTADKVVRELSLVAFSNVRHFEVTPDGKLTVRRSADRGPAPAVSSFPRKVPSVTRGRGDEKTSETEVETEVRLWDKVRALGLLCQHLGMLKTPGPDPIHDLLAKLPADVAGPLRALLAAALPGPPAA